MIKDITKMIIDSTNMIKELIIVIISYDYYTNHTMITINFYKH